MNKVSPTFLRTVYPNNVSTYATLSNLYDDGHQGLFMTVSLAIVADWSIRHRINVKVSRSLLRTVYKEH